MRYLLGGLRVVYHLVPTSNHNRQSRKKPAHRLFIILFLHQTTTFLSSMCLTIRCLSSCSYIKPQPCICLSIPVRVVYHLVPTSNHNDTLHRQMSIGVVYHLVPTSNHNAAVRLVEVSKVVYHLVPTSNHNQCATYSEASELFIILFLHQTTTGKAEKSQRIGCLSSCSYIKPQPFSVLCVLLFVVYHLVPTSNHNLAYV